MEGWSNVTTTELKRMERAAKMTALTTPITKGPFKFDTAQSFSDFQRKVANALPCSKALLPIIHFEWKFEKEAQLAPREEISDLTGYEALIDAIMKNQPTKNVVIWLRCPDPPIRVSQCGRYSCGPGWR